MASLRLSIRDSDGPLLINLWTNQLLSGSVWMLMAWKSSTSISHQHSEWHHQPSQCSHTPVSTQGDFNCQHVDWGYSTTSPDGESLVDGATKSNLVCCIILKTLLASPHAGTPVPTHTWPSRAMVTFAGNWTDVSWKSSLGLNIGHRWLGAPKRLFHNQVSPTSDGTFGKPDGKSTCVLPTGLLGTFHLRTLPALMKPTKTSATPSSTQRKNQFHAVVGKTTDHAGMRSARPSTRHFFGHRRVKALTQLPLPCLPDLIKGEGNAGQRQSMPSTLRTPADWHGMP